MRLDATYFYLDESYAKYGGYWHCAVGGVLLPAARVVDAHIAIETAIHRVAAAGGVTMPAKDEFKAADFFSDWPDALKVEVCRAISAAVTSFDSRFLVSHAFVREERLIKTSGYLAKPANQIQFLAVANLAHFLRGRSEVGLVQMIVDLGLSEAFRPVYTIHSASFRSIPMLKAMGIEDSDISLPNYRTLLPPVFQDSVDSRLLQFADLLVGLLLLRRVGRVKAFKAQLLDALGDIPTQVEFHSVEWMVRTEG